MAKTGASRIKPVDDKTTSIERLRKPDAPETDLCGLELRSADSSFHSIGDELSNLRFEVFTREHLHLLPYLLNRPCHRLQSTDGPHDVICVLFRKQESVYPILNDLGRPTRSKSNDGTAARLSLCRDYTKVFAGGDHHCPGPLVQMPQFVI